SAFMVPITSRLRARWLATALATPTPPIRSVVRPTSVRNWVKRSTLRSSCGEALLRVRISQPASGRSCCTWFCSAVTARSLASAAGRRNRYCQRTRLPGCSRPVARSAASLIKTRGPSPIAPPILSGSLFTGVFAGVEGVAVFQIEPPQQRGIARRAIGAAALREKPGKRHGWIGHHRVDQRIIAVDGFGLDQDCPHP